MLRIHIYSSPRFPYVWLLKVFLVIFLIFPIFLVAEETPIPSISEPDPSPTLEEKELEDDVPLDAWIIPKKLQESPSATDQPSQIPFPNSSLSEEEAVNEEKRIYKALLEEYQIRKDQPEEEGSSYKKLAPGVRRSHSEIFKKTALSKRDQARINRARELQKEVLREQKAEFRDLIIDKKKKVPFVRVCHVNYPIMGLPSEARKVEASISGVKLTEDWKNGLKLIVQDECEIVLYTGVYGKTITKSREFLDKSVEFLNKGTAADWGYKINSDQHSSLFSIFYIKQSVDVIKAEPLAGLSLRRGGVFVDSDFTIPPIEFIVESKLVQTPKRYSFIMFDLRDKTSPLKKPKLTLQMQMASALLEATINRANNKSGGLVLLGNIGETRAHPAFHIMQGAISPADFLEGKACKLMEKEEKKFECDKALLSPQPRTMVGLFTELPTLFNKSDRKALKRNLNHLTSEVFLPQADLNIIKDPNNINRLLGASFDVIKGKQNQFTLLYVDLISQLE